jgi:CRP/FNR family transcriptional regulator, cyclic AMP receptor protein
MSDLTRDRLRPYPIFRGCGPEELDRLLACITEWRLPTSEMVLFEEKVDSDSAYIVESGLLVAELPLDGGVKVEMARMGPGAVVGELCLITAGPRSLRVKCLQPTAMLRIDRRQFEALRQAQDSAAYSVIRNICLTMCDRLRSTNDFIERELRHEMPTRAAETRMGRQSVAERAREYLSELFGRKR